MYIYCPVKIIQFWKYKKMAEFFFKSTKNILLGFSKELKIFDIDETKKAINEFLNYDTTGEVEGSPEIISKYVLDKHIYGFLIVVTS